MKSTLSLVLLCLASSSCALVTVPVKTAGAIVTTTVETTGTIVSAPFGGGKDDDEEEEKKARKKRGKREEVRRVDTYHEEPAPYARPAPYYSDPYAYPGR